MNRTRILQLGVGAILGVAILTVVLISGRDTAGLDVVYCGSTNKQQVVFTINNCIPAPVTYWVGLPQVKTNGVWPRPHITANDGELPAATILAAAGDAKVVLNAPSGGEWRLPVFWEVQGKRPPISGIIRYNLRVLKGWWRLRRHNRFPGITLHGDSSLQTAYSITITR